MSQNMLTSEEIEAQEAAMLSRISEDEWEKIISIFGHLTLEEIIIITEALKTEPTKDARFCAERLIQHFKGMKITDLAERIEKAQRERQNK